MIVVLSPIQGSCGVIVVLSPIQGSCGVIVVLSPIQGSCRVIVVLSPIQGSCGVIVVLSPIQGSCRVIVVCSILPFPKHGIQYLNVLTDNVVSRLIDFNLTYCSYHLKFRALLDAPFLSSIYSFNLDVICCGRTR